MSLTLLIDCHGLGYRAFHSLGGLSHDGTATGVAFGFLSTVFRLGRQYRTNKVVFCWDGGDSVRKAIYPRYKEGRKAVSSDKQKELAAVHAQFTSLRKTILPSLGFNNQLIQCGYEADDIIAHFLATKTNPSIIVSSDHDLFQLLQYHNCRGQHLLSSNKLMTASKFRLEYRILPREWASVKAIAGCPGDGVPGVPGVGEATAIGYLLDELPEGKRKQDITNNYELIHRNYKIVRLPAPGLPDFLIKDDDISIDKFAQVFDDLGFVSFLGEKQRFQLEDFCTGLFS